MSNSLYYKKDSTLVGVCLSSTPASQTQSGARARKRQAGGDACVMKPFNKDKDIDIDITNITTLPSKPLSTVDGKQDNLMFDENHSKLINNENLQEYTFDPTLSFQIRQKVHAQFMYDAYINEME